MHICEDYENTHYIFKGDIVKATTTKQFMNMFKSSFLWNRKSPACIGGWPGSMQWAPQNHSPDEIKRRLKHQDEKNYVDWQQPSEEKADVNVAADPMLYNDVQSLKHAIVEKFPSKVEKLISLSTEGLAAAAFAIARLKVQYHPNDNQCNFCLIRQEDMNMPCGHSMCTDCYNIYRKFDVMFYEIEPEALSIDGLGHPLDKVSFKMCPFHDTSHKSYTGDYADYRLLKC